MRTRPSYQEKVDKWYAKIEAESLEAVEAELGTTDYDNQSAGQAAIRKWEKNQQNKIDREILEEERRRHEQTLGAVRDGNKIQGWILVVLCATLGFAVFSAWLAYSRV